MAFFSRWFGKSSAAPRAAVQSADGGVLISTPDRLDEYLRAGNVTKSGVAVTPEKSMQVAAVYGCVRLISASVATLPLEIKRKVDEKTREDADDTVLSQLIRRKPNRWMKPAQFRRLLQTHVLLRGNGYCLKVRSRGEVRELIPLHPDRVTTKQRDDMSIVHEYRRPNGTVETFRQEEIFHLFGLTLNGLVGVTPITYARETIGLALAMEDQGASTFRTGMRASGVLEHPNKLSQDARDHLKSSLDNYRAGGDSEGRFLILEEGMKQSEMKMTAQDAQWIESRKFSRSDIAMFFGVPPYMLGDTEKSTSWGSGIEQQKDGFVTFTLDDHLVMWEEGITIDLASDPSLYARFNRNALVKGNINDRWNSYTKALQWGVRSPNEIRALEDENPRPGGDIYYPPPNTAGGKDSTDPKPEDKADDTPQDA